MTKAPPADRSERYQALLHAAAEKHHTTATDTRAVFEAGIVLAHEDMTAAMVAGEKIDIAAYLKLSEELQKLVPPPEPIKVTIDIVDSVKGVFNCQHCGERNDIEDYDAPPAPKPAPKQIDGKAIAAVEGTVAKASAPAPAARPAPPPPPPQPSPKPISEAMRAWNGLQGYNRSARDGGLIKGPPVPHSDPNLTNAPARENYNNDKPVCYTGYMDGRRQYGSAAPADPNPNFNSHGSKREPWKSSF